MVRYTCQLCGSRNWSFGFYIAEFEQKGKDRAKYGERLLDELASKIDIKGLSARNLKLFRQFYFSYPQIMQSVIAQLQQMEFTLPHFEKLLLEKPRNTSKIVQSAIAQSQNTTILIPPEKIIDNLSYTHLVQLLPINDPQKRSFYELESIKGIWSVSELKRQINSLLYERCGISAKPDSLISQLKKTPQKGLVKDIYTFEFLGLPQKDAVEENDLETALLNHLQSFLLELGHGFCLEARQKRILIGDDYFFVDLVFYHRILKCHVLIDLKVEQFTHNNAGQLNTYINYYKKNVQLPDDNHPIGILLVTNKNKALVKYATAGMDNNLFVRKYLLQLPDKKQLEAFIINELKKI